MRKIAFLPLLYTARHQGGRHHHHHDHHKRCALLCRLHEGL